MDSHKSTTFIRLYTHTNLDAGASLSQQFIIYETSLSVFQIRKDRPKKYKWLVNWKKIWQENVVTIF